MSTRFIKLNDWTLRQIPSFFQEITQKNHIIEFDVSQDTDCFSERTISREYCKTISSLALNGGGENLLRGFISRDAFFLFHKEVLDYCVLRTLTPQQKGGKLRDVIDKIVNDDDIEDGYLQYSRSTKQANNVIRHSPKMQLVRKLSRLISGFKKSPMQTINNAIGYDERALRCEEILQLMQQSLPFDDENYNNIDELLRTHNIFVIRSEKMVRAFLQFTSKDAKK